MQAVPGLRGRQGPPQPHRARQQTHSPHTARKADVRTGAGEGGLQHRLQPGLWRPPSTAHSFSRGLSASGYNSAMGKDGAPSSTL